MPTDIQREAVKGAYSGDKWLKKVASMSDSQITAIYLRLKAEGKIK
jgi:hypothetical protein